MQKSSQVADIVQRGGGGEGGGTVGQDPPIEILGIFWRRKKSCKEDTEIYGAFSLIEIKILSNFDLLNSQIWLLEAEKI